MRTYVRSAIGCKVKTLREDHDISVKPRRHDPERRKRIIAATLDVIAEHGVAGTTHRRVAVAADVPLGSMTYHFSCLDELFCEAFSLLACEVSQEFVDRLEAAQTLDEAREAVVGLIFCGQLARRRNLVLSYELYAYAARHEEMRAVLTGWMAASRSALEQHFSSETARALDAVIEGVTIHNSASENLIPQDEVRRMVLALTQGASALRKPAKGD